MTDFVKYRLVIKAVLSLSIGPLIHVSKLGEKFN